MRTSRLSFAGMAFMAVLSTLTLTLGGCGKGSPTEPGGGGNPPVSKALLTVTSVPETCGADEAHAGTIFVNDEMEFGIHVNPNGENVDMMVQANAGFDGRYSPTSAHVTNANPDIKSKVKFETTGTLSAVSAIDERATANPAPRVPCWVKVKPRT